MHYTLLVLSLIILGLSTGWLLIMFGIVLIPVIILRIYAIKRSKAYPQLGLAMKGASIVFLFFSLLRPDFVDTGGAFTGLSAIQSRFGVITDNSLDDFNENFLISLLLLAFVIFLDIVTLVKVKRLSKEDNPD